MLRCSWQGLWVRWGVPGLGVWEDFWIGGLRGDGVDGLGGSWPEALKGCLVWSPGGFPGLGV